MTEQEKEDAINEALMTADDYEIGISLPDNEMRVLFKDEMGDIISIFICDAPDAYAFAQKILRAYDELERI